MTFANSEHLPVILAVAILVFMIFLLYVWYRFSVLKTYFSRMLDISHYGRRYLLSVFLTALILGVFSLLFLKVQWGYTLKKQRSKGVDLVIALDVSRSMYTEDVGTSRLARAKNAVRYASENLPGRIGLIVFAGEAFTQCPLTDDRSAFNMYLDYAGADSVPLQGTDIGKALAEAERLFTKQNPNEKVLLLITDGEDHERNVRGALDELVKNGVTVHTASIGKEKGAVVPVADEDGSGIYLKDRKGELVKSSADPAVLKLIASESGGSYISLNSSVGHLKAILSKVSKGEKSDFGSKYVREGKDRFQIFALFCIVLLIFDLLLNVRWKQ